MNKMLYNTMQDLRLAVRQLRKSPGFTATAIITLALGVGANTAIFTLAQGTLLRSLAIADPALLVICAVATGFVAARRASSIEPMRALRID
jgi:ABC-type lipoprotein release transport system permease subunit